MDTSKLKQYLWDEFPTVFTTSFAREMLENILDRSEEMKDADEQLVYLLEMIPQIQGSEIRQFIPCETK